MQQIHLYLYYHSLLLYKDLIINAWPRWKICGSEVVL